MGVRWNKATAGWQDGRGKEPARARRSRGSAARTSGAPWCPRAGRSAPGGRVWSGSDRRADGGDDEEEEEDEEDLEEEEEESDAGRAGPDRAGRGGGALGRAEVTLARRRGGYFMIEKGYLVTLPYDRAVTP